MLLMALPATAAAEVVVRDRQVCEVFSLRGTVFYVRAADYCGAAPRPYGRVVDGRRRAVTGLPEGASFIRSIHGSSMGLDRAGRVVVTVTDGNQWWLYDVAADVSRPVRPPARPDCVVTMLSIWRTSLAYNRSCGPSATAEEGYFLLRKGRERRLAGRPWSQAGSIRLRWRTVGYIGIDDGDDVWTGRLADDGRPCPQLFYYGSAWGLTPRDLWVQRGRLVVLMGAVPDAGSHTWNWKDASLWELDLGKPCSAARKPTKLFDVPPGLRAQAVAVDDADLYYADDRAIHRRPLASID